MSYIFGAFLLLLVFLIVWNGVQQVQLQKFKKRNAELFSGRKVANVEDLLLAHVQALKTLDKDIQELYNISNQINRLASRGFHKMGFVRFNPFKDVGGDQSFAIALLDGKSNGLTLSSLYTREGARVYAKFITAGQSEKHPLTEEEKKAIEMAISQDKKLK
ncbi:MAG: DUF4446 family protein [Candidatus Pacebacteria bacterium]|nr:DUF4446 family protein [Candidatus Paceibacterota bacterium]